MYWDIRIEVKVGNNLMEVQKEYLSQLTHDYYQMIDAIQAVLGPRK